MIKPKQLSSFLEFIKQRQTLKTNFILGLLFLLFLPARNYYYSLTITPGLPLVRSLNQKLLPPSDYPVNHSKTPAPYVSARSVMVIDVDSKAILYQENPDLKLLPASTTKIMTALVALDIYPLDKIITVGSVNGNGQQMGLEVGERITVENLLYGLLVHSGNDAASVLAQNHPDGEKGFIQAMNQKAADLGLKDTQFANPAGLDDFGHYTTAHDLALLAAEAMQQPVFAKMVSIMGITVADVDNTIVHQLETVNQLLGQVAGLAGVKTGWTELAGECLVAYTERQGRKIITVVLGSQDRFADSQQLINWAFTNYRWVKFSPPTDQ